VSSKSNLFIDESSSSKVNSPVISLAVNSCDGTKRRRRRRKRRGVSASSASTSVDINLSEPSQGIAVNDTPPADSDEGLILSVFNLTSPGKVPISNYWYLGSRLSVTYLRNGGLLA